MNTVICVAAGLSSRMGSFKPLLPLGDATIIRTLIARYRSCGIGKIILVTGHNADLLEEHVHDLDIRCCRNENYASSDMFESVKIGIRTYLESGEAPRDDDRIFLTPGDIPLVKASTINALIEAAGDVCIPTMDGETGHPLRLSCRVLERILSYDGPSGLQGALRSIGADAMLIPVNDPGILVDADTPEDYEKLKQLLE